VAFREALQEVRREQAPRDWAMIRTKLANVLAALGERDEGTERLEQAVAAFREIAAALGRDGDPLDRATLQVSIGNASQVLAERADAPTRLRDAVAAFREALRIYTGIDAPGGRVMARVLLGNALVALGSREDGTDGTKGLDEAVALCLDAMNEPRGVSADQRRMAEWTIDRANALLRRRLSQ
jgi:hypothetical protein